MNYSQFISSWGNLFRTLILLFCFVLGIYLIIKNIAGDSSVALNFEGTEVKIGENGAMKNHLVPPRGWTDSGILVKAGDRIHVSSTGSVNISLGNMVERLKVFTSIFKTKENNNIDLFTDEEVDAASFVFPWNDARGVQLTMEHDSTAIRSIATVQNQLLDPNAKLGQLLIYNFTGDGYPLIEQLTSLEEVFRFDDDNPELLIEIKKSGRIYFGINDMVLFNHKMSQLLWQDNVGFLSINTFIEYKN